MKTVPSNLINLKSEVDKVDVHKLVAVPVDLNKLSDVVKNDIGKKYLYNSKIKNTEDKIPHVTNLATDTTLNAKINEFKNEISSITNVSTIAALAAVEIKIPDVSNLVKKTDYNAKINEIKKKITDMFMINILLHKNLISKQQKILL